MAAVTLAGRATGAMIAIQLHLGDRRDRLLLLLPSAAARPSEWAAAWRRGPQPEAPWRVMTAVTPVSRATGVMLVFQLHLGDRRGRLLLLLPSAAARPPGWAAARQQ